MKFYGYGIVDKDGHPYWSDVSVCEDASPMDDECEMLNDNDSDLGVPYRVVELVFSSNEDGAGLISAERTRQIHSEGWTPEHDDQHENEELVNAAIAYCLGPIGARNYWPWIDDHGNSIGFKPAGYEPAARIKDLTRAGALIAAEIDRLQRKLIS